MLSEQMIILFLVMCAGYYCSKKKFITEEVNKGLSAIVVNIANPALILAAGMTEDKIELHQMLLMCGIATIMFTYLLILAAFFPKLLKVEEKSRGTYSAMTVFGNIAFMGFPILSASFGEVSLLYASVFVVMFNILIYTYGVTAMRVGQTEENVPHNKKESFANNIKKIFNVGVISCIIAFIIYIADWNIPIFIHKTIDMLGNITGPISMMVIGASFASMNIKSLFSDKKLILFILIRLLIVPSIGMLFVNHFVDQDIMRGVCMVMLATPVASMTTMVARQYNGDYVLSAKGIAISTIFSVVTMPIIQMIFL